MSERELSLHPLSVEDSTDVYDMLQKIGKEENEFHNEVNGMSFEEFKEWLKVQDGWAKGTDLPPGYVRQWTFWLYDGDRPVGYGKLREKLTDHSREIGGNVGYAIASDQRGKGYGSALFSMLIQKARENRLPEILSTVEKCNPVSALVHEKCGGKLVKENDQRWYYSFDVNA